MDILALLNAAKPWLPIVIIAVVLAYLGKFFTAKIWTKDAAERNALMRFMRKVLPLHPVVAGALIGLIPAVPVAPVFTDGIWGRVLQGVLAGVLSVWGYDAAREWFKRRGFVPPSTAPKPPEDL